MGFFSVANHCNYDQREYYALNSLGEKASCNSLNSTLFNFLYSFQVHNCCNLQINFVLVINSGLQSLKYYPIHLM